MKAYKSLETKTPADSTTTTLRYVVSSFWIHIEKNTRKGKYNVIAISQYTDLIRNKKK